MDEIGRGPSTYDGMSIARAGREYCAGVVCAKTLFSTHYHELAAAANETECVMNYNIAAQKRGDKVVFLRKIVPGSASKSYGVEVAALAGVPELVVTRASHLLRAVEMEGELAREREKAPRRVTDKVVVQTDDGPREYPAWAAAAAEEIRRMSEAKARGEKVKYDMTQWFPKDISLVVDTYAAGLPVLEQLDETDVNNLTPMEALELVAELKKHIERAGWKWELNWPDATKTGDPS